MKNKLLSVLIVLNIFVLSGCGSAKSGQAASTWIDSDIKGNVTADTQVSVKDDFAAAANKDLYVSEELEDSNLGNIERVVTERKREIIEDASVTGKGIEEARKLISLAEDWDARNALGVEPLRPYIESIETISNVEELYQWITDTTKNPLRIAPIEIGYIDRSLVYPSVYFVMLQSGKLTLSNPDSYFRVSDESAELMLATEEKVTYVLSRLGYETDQIQNLLNNTYKYEKQLCSIMDEIDTEDEEDLTFARGEIEFIQGDYPLTAYIDNFGYEACPRFLASERLIKQVDSLCSLNVENIKSMLIVHYTLETGAYLDKDTYEYFEKCDKRRDVIWDPDTRTEYQINEDRIMDYLSNSTLEGAMDLAYIDKYIDKNSYDRLYKMTENLIDEYKIIFANEDWLTEEGKKACIDKLNAIKIHIVAPDEADYSDLNIIPKEEGGNLLNAYFAIARFADKKDAEIATAPVNRAAWSPYIHELSTLLTNSFYNPTTNGIYICAGILDKPAFYPEMSDEEMLAGIGVIVGHEITHGFDAGGVLYDKDGIKNTWMSSEDQNAFNDRTSKVVLYYSSLKPFESSGMYNGNQVQTEATADMGGLKATLAIAKQYENFDYDKFFRYFAHVWAMQTDIDEERYYLEYDVHPLAFLRINVSISQYEEFYETYDIKPGDGMYVEPEKRIAVW